MGCGASKSVPTNLEENEQHRDPEDYILDPIQLQVTKIEEFDEVFTHLSSLLNRIIELNNNVHLAVGAVKATYAPLAGGFELVVSLAPATDVVLLDIQSSRSNTSRPSADHMQRLAQPPVMQAAAELEQARTSLHAFLAASPTHIPLRLAKDGTLATDGPAPDLPPELQRFNTCMARLQGLLDANGHLTAMVKSTAAFGTTTVKAWLFKRTQSADSPVNLAVINVLEACCSPAAARIKQAEAFLVDRAQHLANRIRGLELEWEVVSGYFLVLRTEIPNPDIQQQVAKLLQAVNIALFKLLNAGAGAATEASLTNAVVQLVKPIFTALIQRHTNLLSYNLKTLVSVNPTVVFTKEEEGVPPSFEFSLNVDLKEQAGILPFPECLPEQPTLLLVAMEHLINHILGALQELPAISQDVDVLLEQAKEFYELCPEAAARRGLSMMEAVKCSKATGGNLRMLYNTQELFLAFGENIKRIADELGASAPAVHKLMDKMLVETKKE